MAENKISYLNRNYEEYRNAIIQNARKYYPDVFANIDDASIGQFLIDVISDIGDNLNYHIDRVFQETSLGSAKEFNSLQDIARTNGLKIPYKKAAMVEIELSCVLPLTNDTANTNGEMMADEAYAPIIKRGTKFSNGMTTFELLHDVNFSEQFDENGISNRQEIPNRNSNGSIISYTYKKLARASACQTKILKRVISSTDVRPFAEVIIDDNDVLGVDSILIKEGTNINTDPQFSEFFIEAESFKDASNLTTKRFFETESLIDQYYFGAWVNVDSTGKPALPTWHEIEVVSDGDTAVTVRQAVKGKWKRFKNKFITEYTDDWKLKIIFGAGLENQYGQIPQDADKFTQYQMSRMTANDYMGVIPQAGNTMYILYRVGGGEISNIAANTLTNIIGLNIEINGRCDQSNNSIIVRNVIDSVTVTNTTPSYGGKDAPTREEIKYMIKYNSSSQNRCVTLKDYQIMIDKIPAKYGCPFRTGIIEENNKIVIYTLGLDYLGHLQSMLSEVVADNIKEYLSNYKTITDFVEIKSGKVVNVQFNVTVYIDKTYDKSEVVKRIIDLIYDYMDIRNHEMGEDIYLGDLQKEISKLDGVVNLVNLRCFNPHGNGYSDDVCTQELVDYSSCCFNEYEQYEADELPDEIDLKKSDYMLFTEANSMFEIKDKVKDITVITKIRN